MLEQSFPSQTPSPRIPQGLPTRPANDVIGQDNLNRLRKAITEAQAEVNVAEFTQQEREICGLYARDAVNWARQEGITGGFENPAVMAHMMNKLGQDAKDEHSYIARGLHEKLSAALNPNGKEQPEDFSSEIEFLDDDKEQ